MQLNADFARRAAVVAHDDGYVHSPESGVDRLMLDRIGGEVARATTIVRYAPGSRFPRHEHAMGEEFLVLEGVFSDETGDYPAGNYVRNPPGSGHAPFSDPGCRILVKLRQFDADDLTQFAIDTRDERAWLRNTLPLHRHGGEVVRMQRLEPGARLDVDPADAGTEVFVVAGEVALDDRQWPAESWLRFPAGDQAALVASTATLLWVKTGHLPVSG